MPWNRKSQFVVSMTSPSELSEDKVIDCILPDDLAPDGLAGARLDAALAVVWPESGLRARRRLWDWCRVLVNGRARPPGYIVQGGDRIVVEAIEQAPEQEYPVTVVAVSEEYAALYKPAGLHSAHIAGGSEPSLESLLPKVWPRLAAGGVGQTPLLLTRLDQATSGLVMVACDQEALGKFRRWEQEGRVEKEYFALARGQVQGPLTLRNRLLTADCAITQALAEPDPDENRHTHAESLHYCTLPPPWPEGLPATLLRVCIRRGARHQIRVHLAKAGYPLAGERQYAGPPPGGCPLYLHHAKISFPGFSAEVLPLPTDWPGLALPN